MGKLDFQNGFALSLFVCVFFHVRKDSILRSRQTGYHQVSIYVKKKKIARSAMTNTGNTRNVHEKSLLITCYFLNNLTLFKSCGANFSCVGSIKLKPINYSVCNRIATHCSFLRALLTIARGLNKSLYNSEQNGAEVFVFGQNRNFL